MTRYGVKTRILNTAANRRMTGARSVSMGANNARRNTTVADTKKDTMRACAMRIERIDETGEGIYARYLKMLILGTVGA